MKLQMTGKLFLVFAALACLPLKADLVATVDRTVISDADLLTLTVRASDETADHEPDLSVLDRDFEVVSVTPQRNNSFTIVNGQTSRVSYVDYVIRLSPKRMGELNIPALRAGNDTTRAIAIRVQRLSAAQRQQMNQHVFFETTVDTNEVYVQGQIIYSVKLFYTEAIGGDFPQAPALPDTVVETLENEKRYESIITGKRYYVLEKRYAIFPQRSGELVIPRERFIGSRGRGGFFSRKQSVTAVSESHTINVRRIPESFTGDNWIPARALAVKETWGEAAPTFRVGEPVNRTITLSAIGLSSASLPAMSEMTIDNAKVYADPPAAENRVSEGGMNALQVTTVGIVPTVEGELFIPEIRIPWWNTQTDRQDVAVIPAATFTVLPSVNEAADVPTVTVPVTELSQPTVVQEVASPYWQWAAITLGLLWLLSTWQWLGVRRQLKVLESATAKRYEAATFEDPDEQRQYKALKTACNRNRPADVHRQLFLWAKARNPEIQSIHQVASQEDQLAAELDSLETHLFGGAHDTTWRGSALLAAVDEIRQRRETLSRKSTLEPALNPA